MHTRPIKMAYKKFKAYCPRCRKTTTGKLLCWDCGSKKYTSKPAREEENNMVTGRLDIELKAAGAEALEIPNPLKAKTVLVQCITAKKTKETLSELHMKVLQAISNHETNEETMVALHEAFVWANKELQLKGE